jgi:hypothetical protein
VEGKDTLVGVIDLTNLKPSRTEDLSPEKGAVEVLVDRPEVKSSAAR